VKGEAVNEWSVRIESVVVDEPSDDQIERLAVELEPDHGAVGINDDGSIGAQLMIEARSVHSASEKAFQHFRRACEIAGVKAPMTSVEVQPWDVFEAEQDSPIVPELLGVTEMAAKLGVSRQRIAQLSEREDWPPPVAQLAAGPVWAGPSVDRFLASWDRHRTGRPRKVAVR
jgi:hypothetical protein